jgi:hypothetical protein
LKKREEKEQRKQWWYKIRREAGREFLNDMNLRLQVALSKDENTEERNDVYLYKTLRYPPTSTPPTTE